MLSSDIRSVLQIWSEGLTTVIEQTSGKSVAFELKNQHTLTSPTSVKFAVAIIGKMSGTLTFHFSESSIAILAASFLGEDRTTYVPEDLEAIQEILNQVSGIFRDQVRPQVGDLEINLSTACETNSQDCPFTLLSRGITQDIEIGIELDQSIIESIKQFASTPEPQNVTNQVHQPSNLDMILDLELDLMLHFGSRSMPLSDVLAIAPGAVIELDRQVNEKVDLMLDNRVVARGEVVIVDGNYGLRITELAAKEGSRPQQ